MRVKKGEQKEEREQNGRDYNEYRMPVPECILYTLLAGAVLFAVGWVFYRKIPLCLAAAAFGVFYPNIRKKQMISSQKKKLTMQFKDMLYSLSSAVGAGSSIENAIKLTLNDLLQQYNDPNCFIIEELRLMVGRLQMNQSIEEVFRDFAERSHVEDIQTFAGIFEIAKRTGGNLIEIIRNTTDLIAEKVEIQMEIDTVLAGQKMQQKVLVAMPVFLVFFMTEAGGGFMDPMFEGAAGIAVSTVVLICIIAGALWSKKISDIRA